MSGYIGPSPVPQSIQRRQTFTATAAQTTFGTTGYTDGDFIDVYLNGVKLVGGTDYTATNGTDVVLTTGAAAGDILDFVTFNSFQLNAPSFDNSLTLQNATEEDTDGGRESTIIFKGEQSGGEISTLAEIEASHDGTADDEKGDLIFRTNDGADGSAPTERLRIDSLGNVGIGTSSPQSEVDIQSATPALHIEETAGNLFFEAGTTASGPYITYPNSGYLRFATSTGANAAGFTERMRIDSSGNLLVGKTALGATAGVTLYNTGLGYFVRDGNSAILCDRRTSDGDIMEFRKDGTTVGSIGSNSSGGLYIQSQSASTQGILIAIRGSGGTTNLVLGATGTSYGYIGDTSSSAVGLAFVSSRVQAVNSSTGASADNTYDLGVTSVRFDDIFATNGTIQTSDQNEKQQIASLTDAEITAAKAISKLFKTFKWNDSVAEKGDAARTHTGVIAQEVEQAMTDAGLNAGDYAFFIDGTWWEADEAYTDDDGVEQTRTNTYDTAEEAPDGATERNRKGIRYPQLLSFIGAATEQRLASIESRLDALENPA